MEIAERIKDQNLTQTQAAGVLQGTSGINPEMTLHLSETLGWSLASWLTMQDNHDLSQAHQTVDLDAVERIYFGAT